jgi:hemolysin III
MREECEGSDAPPPGFLSTELASGVTHGVGLLASIVGLVLLVLSSARHGGARTIAACSVYGATLVLLYLASTLYHTSPWNTPARRVLRIIDHSAIYLLIAGTYTPITLITLNGPWGWSLFGVVWGLALVGIAFKAFFCGRFELVSGLFYLVMGWLAVVAIVPLVERIPLAGLVWLFAGGVAYTAGVIFYARPVVRHHHAVWHLFVMLGSTCHFFAVLYYVVRPPG